MKCKVCGRTEEELEDEFGNDMEIQNHQGMKKCSKCIREYEVETQTDRDTSSDDMESDDWKSQIMA